jgi:hypothetical protein
VDVSEPDAFEASGPGGGEAALRLFPGGARQVRHQEVAVKAKKGVRYGGILVGNE